MTFKEMRICPLNNESLQIPQKVELIKSKGESEILKTAGK